MSFAENFRNARKAAGLTQQQVAEALDLDRSAVAHYEIGDSMPNVRNLQILCELMNTTLNELLCEKK